jgi:hypothetical protein
MERKRLIAVIIIAIVVVAVFGWYFLYGTQKAKPTVLADVTIDKNDYTVPINWTLTAVPSATNETSHTISNDGNNVTSIVFNVTIAHLEGTQWVEQFNGTNWLVQNKTVQPSIVVIGNTTAGPWIPLANKLSSGESSTYSYNLTYNDKTIYFNLKYLGSNPTVDDRTVFAYVAFDNNGNGKLDASDKAFNFTSNPSLPFENDLKIYAPLTSSSWNATPASEYVWNGNVSSSNVPITVLCFDNRTNITFAIPFSYIGATKNGQLGFALQAFSHDWATAANSTTPAKYTVVPLAFPSVLSFTMEPHTTLTFYTKAVFTSAASGDYSIVFKFQATVQKSS